jgi:NADPH-dependent F420 reductase
LRLGIIGGTGRMGRGLALRLVKNHAVVIGSRSSDKAEKTAEELNAIARGFYKNKMEGYIKGSSNADAIKHSETVIVTIPPKFTLPVIKQFKEYFLPEQIVVSTVVSMKKRKGIFWYTPLSRKGNAGEETKSAAELTQEIIRPTHVVSAFHTVPAAYLSSLDEVLNVDVFVAGNDDSAINEVSKLICDIPNFRPLKIGPLENSRLIESMVPLLLNAATLNNLEEPSIRVVPWIPTSYGACG